MSVWVAIVLGFIQGITEFLPISSSGHLMLAEGILGITFNYDFFNVLLHFATLLSIILIFKKEILNLILHPFSKSTLCVFVAALSTCVIAFIIKLLATDLFEATFLGFGFLITATLLLITQASLKNNKPTLAPISYFQAITVGLFQGIAVLPGISRSGITICSGRIAGLSKESAVKFSFILAIPTIIASMAYELIFSTTSLQQISFVPCLIGSLVAFLTSILSIKFMLKLAKKEKWVWFAAYLFVLSFIVLLFTFGF